MLVMKNGGIWICLVAVNVFVIVVGQGPGSPVQTPPVGSGSSTGAATGVAADPWMQLMLAYQNMMTSMRFGNNGIMGNQNMMTSFPYAAWGWGDDGDDIFDD